MKLNIVSILCLCTLATGVFGHKILFMVPINGKSHWNYVKVFIEELLNRGHEVTCITSNSMADRKLVNYTEILINPPFNMRGLSKEGDIFKKQKTTQFETLRIFSRVGSMSSAHALADKNVQEFIHRNDLHFDLVINEEVYHDAFLMFAIKFKAPVVTICPYGISEFFDHEMGLITPLSHVSHTLLSFTDNMNFSERWYNSLFMLCDIVIRQFVHISSTTELIQKHFGHLGPLPSFDELRKNISVIFVNAHRSITHPRPSMPGLVFIGGAHIKPPKPLPAVLQQFLDESEHGVIYFSLGTVFKSSNMPKEKINIFLETFERLKQRVIWKFEDESIPDLPENVLIRKWLPQADLLAHPNVVLFISHGGMFSNFEAIKYGVQMLMIPFAGDQFRNAQKSESAGYGKYLSFDEITNETLFDNVNEMLTDKKYSNRAKEIAAVFGDNIVHPMDEFIWWIEHVIRFQGAKHLKSHAAEMSLFTLLLLDVILVNLLIVLTVSFGIYYSIKLICLEKRSIGSRMKRQLFKQFELLFKKRF